MIIANNRIYNKINVDNFWNPSDPSNYLVVSYCQHVQYSAN